MPPTAVRVSAMGERNKSGLHVDADNIMEVKSVSTHFSETETTKQNGELQSSRFTHYNVTGHLSDVLVNRTAKRTPPRYRTTFP